MKFKRSIYLLIFISFPVIYFISDPINAPNSNFFEVCICVVISLIIMFMLIKNKK